MSAYNNPLTEYSPEMETFEAASQFDQGEGVFSESEEMELAAEMLDVANEQELEQFLGDLIKKAGNAIGQFVKSPVAKAIGGALKSAAKVALPVAGGALGAWVGGPLGAQLGSGLGSMAGQALGLELEGLSPEDREFEATKQFVRFAGETVKNALQAPQNLDPAAIAAGATTEAARTHAPGLMPPGTPVRGNHRSGRWARRGNTILIFGA